MKVSELLIVSAVFAFSTVSCSEQLVYGSPSDYYGPPPPPHINPPLPPPPPHMDSHGNPPNYNHAESPNHNGNQVQPPPNMNNNNHGNPGIQEPNPPKQPRSAKKTTKRTVR